MELGYVASDWVEITHRMLTKEDALALEKELIEHHQPTYNKVLGRRLCKVDAGLLEAFEEMRKEGMSYKEIADSVDVSTMTVYRALNGQTKNAGYANA